LQYHIFCWCCPVRYCLEVFKDVHSGFPVCVLSWILVLVITFMDVSNIANWSATGSSCVSIIWERGIKMMAVTTYRLLALQIHLFCNFQCVCVLRNPYCSWCSICNWSIFLTIWSCRCCI
jgi:hypothetical protein